MLICSYYIAEAVLLCHVGAVVEGTLSFKRGVQLPDDVGVGLLQGLCDSFEDPELSFLGETSECELDYHVTNPWYNHQPGPLLLLILNAPRVNSFGFAMPWLVSSVNI